MLSGDKTGPAIIAHTYGDVRPDHLLAQAQRIRLTVSKPDDKAGQGMSIKMTNTLPAVPAGSAPMSDATDSREVALLEPVECDSQHPAETFRNLFCATLNQLVFGSSPNRGTSSSSISYARRSA
jgi:hypothetical protein